MVGIIPKLIIPVYAVSIMWMLLGVQFRDVFSRSHRWVIPYILAAIALNVGTFMVFGGETFGKLIFFVMHLPTILFFALVSPYRGVKLGFVFFTALIFCALPVISIKILFKYFTPISVSLQFLFYLLICFAILWILYRFFRPSFLYMLHHGSNQDFINFSLMPLLCGIYFFLSNHGSFSIPSTQPSLAGIMPVLLCIISYFLLLAIFKRTRNVQLLQNEKAMLTMQVEAARQQFGQLKAMQEQTIVYRHDMRHHFALLSSFAAEGNLKKIKEYLCTSQAALDSVTPIRFCQNETINLILTYFHQKAEQSSVRLMVAAQVPASLPIPEAELCTLLSNGLENAIHAAMQIPEEHLKSVHISIQTHHDNLLIFMENNFIGKIVMENGLPQSSRKDHGFGTKSMAVIAEKHRGYCSFGIKDNLLTLRILLPLK